MLGLRAMFDALGDHKEFVRAEHNVAVPQLDRELSLHHQKQLIGLGVTVPHELPLQFDDLHIVIVDARNAVGLPVLGDCGESGGEIGCGG